MIEKWRNEKPPTKPGILIVGKWPGAIRGDVYAVARLYEPEHGGGWYDVFENFISQIPPTKWMMLPSEEE